MKSPDGIAASLGWLSRWRQFQYRLEDGDGKAQWACALWQLL